MKKLVLATICLFLLLSYDMSAQQGRRQDITEFTPAQRETLKNLILDYASANSFEVVLEHVNMDPNNGPVFGEFHNFDEYFLCWHRGYISRLEDYLMSNGGSMFVPLPRWDPFTCIPNEFFIDAVIDDPQFIELEDQCPFFDLVFGGSGPFGVSITLNYDVNRFKNQFSLCSAYLGTSPAAYCGVTRTSSVDKFAADLECEHNAVHRNIGGQMADGRSPAAAIFWIWHAWVDDVYYDYQTLCQGLTPAQALAAPCNLNTPCTTLQATPSTLSFPFAGNTQNVSITSNGGWTAISSESWLSLSDFSGTGNDVITATAAPNTGSTRFATITITCGTLTRTISVSQENVVATGCTTLTVNPTFISSSGFANVQTISISSDGPWTATTNRNWIALSPVSGNGPGTLTVALSANNLSFDRYGSITITCGGITRPIFVIQDCVFPRCINLRSPESDLDSEPEEKEIVSGVYPNPFDQEAQIYFNLPKAASVSLEVRDFSGKTIAQFLKNEALPAGEYSEYLNGNNFVTGVYFYILRVDDEIRTGKMVLKR